LGPIVHCPSFWQHSVSGLAREDAIGQKDYFTAMNTFGARSTLKLGSREYEIYRLDALSSLTDIRRLPYSLKILLEALLRTEDGVSVTRQDI